MKLQNKIVIAKNKKPKKPLPRYTVNTNTWGQFEFTNNTPNYRKNPVMKQVLLISLFFILVISLLSAPNGDLDCDTVAKLFESVTANKSQDTSLVWQQIFKD